MDPIARTLGQNQVVILDGALATELERRGCDLRDPLWSAKVLIERPDLIRSVHADYYAAGADCAITASYQATFEGFARRGIGEAGAAELMARSVALAREARDALWADESSRAGRALPFVAASVGPYGAFLADGSEYRGDYALSVAELVEFHRPRMAALLSAGADMLACETIPSLDEARAICLALESFPGASAWVSFSARDGAHTCHGEPFADCVAEIGAHPQVAAVGVNCTAPEHIASLIRAARLRTAKPIVVYPNSGESYHASEGVWGGRPTHTAFGAEARSWFEEGARVIGGCCRTGPHHIREIASWARHPAA